VHLFYILSATSPGKVSEKFVFFSVWRVLTLSDVTAFGDRAFSTAGPLVWNYLPTDLSVSSGALNSTHSLTSDSHGLYIQPF